MRPPDMLRFVGGVVSHFEVGWTGPWPPPERMILSKGLLTGLIKVCNEDALDDPKIASLVKASDTIVFTRYKRKSASTLPDDFDSPNVFRGAEYVPEEES